MTYLYPISVVLPLRDADIRWVQAHGATTACCARQRLGNSLEFLGVSFHFAGGIQPSQLNVSSLIGSVGKVGGISLP